MQFAIPRANAKFHNALEEQKPESTIRKKLTILDRSCPCTPKPRIQTWICSRSYKPRNVSSPRWTLRKARTAIQQKISGRLGQRSYSWSTYFHVFLSFFTHTLVQSFRYTVHAPSVIRAIGIDGRTDRSWSTGVVSQGAGSDGCTDDMWLPRDLFETLWNRNKWQSTTDERKSIGGGKES